MDTKNPNETEKKTAYDEEYAEALYESYQNNEIDDSNSIDKLKSDLSSREILILAPGASILTERDRIEKFISDNNLYVRNVY